MLEKEPAHCKYVLNNGVSILIKYVLNKVAPILIILIIFMTFYGDEQLAIYKAQNDKNISSSCGYYTTEKAKYGNIEYIDLNGWKASFPSRKSNFPIKKKAKKLREDVSKNPSKCFQFKYVESGFFLGRKIYIYDYIDK